MQCFDLFSSCAGGRAAKVLKPRNQGRLTVFGLMFMMIICVDDRWSIDHVYRLSIIICVDQIVTIDCCKDKVNTNSCLNIPKHWNEIKKENVFYYDFVFVDFTCLSRQLSCCQLQIRRQTLWSLLLQDEKTKPKWASITINDHVPNGLLRSGITIYLQSQVSSDPFLMISQGQLCDPFTHATTLAYYSRKNEKRKEKYHLSTKSRWSSTTSNMEENIFDYSEIV